MACPRGWRRRNGAEWGGELVNRELGVRHEADLVQQMEVLPEELSIRLGSYRRGGEGNRPVGAGEKGVCFRQAATQASRNASKR